MPFLTAQQAPHLAGHRILKSSLTATLALALLSPAALLPTAHARALHSHGEKITAQPQDLTDSATAKVGDPFTMTFPKESCTKDQERCIPAGTILVGHITGVTTAKQLRAGKISADFDHAVLPDGREVPVPPPLRGRSHMRVTSGDNVIILHQTKRQVWTSIIGHAASIPVLIVGGGATAAYLIGTAVGGVATVKQEFEKPTNAKYETSKSKKFWYSMYRVTPIYDASIFLRHRKNAKIGPDRPAVVRLDDTVLNSLAEAKHL